MPFPLHLWRNLCKIAGFLLSGWGNWSTKYKKCISWVLCCLHGAQDGAGVHCMLNDSGNESQFELEVPLSWVNGASVSLFTLWDKWGQIWALFFQKGNMPGERIWKPVLLWVVWVDSFNVEGHGWEGLLFVVAINDDLHIFVIYKMVTTLHNTRNTSLGPWNLVTHLFKHMACYAWFNPSDKWYPMLYWKEFCLGHFHASLIWIFFSCRFFFRKNGCFFELMPELYLFLIMPLEQDSISTESWRP